MRSRAREVLVVALLATACGLSTSGSLRDDAATPGGDSGAAEDGSTVGPGSDASGGEDGAVADGGLDADGAAVVEDGGADADADADAGPPVFSYDCNGTPVASCAGCLTKSLGCVYCKTGVGTVVGKCVSSGGSCDANVPGGYALCSCATKMVAKCPPLANMVCNGDDHCEPCGDTNTDALACRGGKSCNQLLATCQ